MTKEKKVEIYDKLNALNSNLLSKIANTLWIYLGGEHSNERHVFEILGDPQATEESGQPIIPYAKWTLDALDAKDKAMYVNLALELLNKPNKYKDDFVFTKISEDDTSITFAVFNNDMLKEIHEQV